MAKFLEIYCISPLFSWQIRVTNTGCSILYTSGRAAVGLAGFAAHIDPYHELLTPHSRGLSALTR